MDLDRAFLVVCLTVAGVVAINVMIFLSVRRGKDVTTIDLMRKAARRVRNPWQDEDDALEELSELVSGLKSVSQEPEGTDEQPNREEA